MKQYELEKYRTRVDSIFKPENNQSTLLSVDANNLRNKAMKSFKFEQMKRSAMPDFIRRSRQDIIAARKSKEQEDLDAILSPGKGGSDLKNNKDFAKFFEEKVTKNSGGLDHKKQ